MAVELSPEAIVDWPIEVETYPVAAEDPMAVEAGPLANDPPPIAVAAFATASHPSPMAVAPLNLCSEHTHTHTHTHTRTHTHATESCARPLCFYMFVSSKHNGHKSRNTKDASFTSVSMRRWLLGKAVHWEAAEHPDPAVRRQPRQCASAHAASRTQHHSPQHLNKE